MKHYFAKLALIGLMLALWPARWGNAQQAAPSEYQVKAAFLYNFTKFVRWPDCAFSDAASPFVICILGQDPFGQSLELAIKGKNVNGHPLEVRDIKSAAEAKNCRVLFICREPKRKMAETIASLGKACILTVGESEEFASAGGMITFVMENSKVRFVINEAAVAKADLSVSSKLLNVAKKVERNGSNN